MRRVGGIGLPRAAGVKTAIWLTVAAIIGVTVLLVLSGRRTLTVAGLRQIPSSALPQLNARLGTDGRRYISANPLGSSIRSLVGAAPLGRAGHTLRLEISTEYYFHLKDKPPNGAPASWAGATENYSVTFVRTSPGHWQVASIKLIPQPHVHEG
jgi:hypothetical protein